MRAPPRPKIAPPDAGAGRAPPAPYPLDRTNNRELEPDYSGPVAICDIDKTYLATKLESLRALLAIPFELAVDKRAIPGMAAVLREIRRGPGARSRLTPLYFVSASPPSSGARCRRRCSSTGSSTTASRSRISSRSCGTARGGVCASTSPSS